MIQNVRPRIRAECYISRQHMKLLSQLPVNLLAFHILWLLKPMQQRVGVSHTLKGFASDKPKNL
jgi:cyanate permease